MEELQILGLLPSKTLPSIILQGNSVGKASFTVHRVGKTRELSSALLGPERASIWPWPLTEETGKRLRASLPSGRQALWWLLPGAKASLGKH